MISVIGIQGVEEIAPGNPLASQLAGPLSRSGCGQQPGDVLVVASKVVSKAEGRTAALADIRVSDEAAELARRTRKEPRLVALVLAESVEVIRAAPGVLITRHRSGHIMANAGIDQSNVGGTGEGHVLLLPEDPNRSAEQLRAGLATVLPNTPAVVISDSFGRPWRLGVVNVAIGAAGLPSLVDRRGEKDRDGREMMVTQVALADLIASARSEERRVGKECRRLCRSRWSPYH
jgi:coenzyme F420-0:L-glutamate ligase/coenzyme F420-1:gamma-L-glutamate ligase